MPYTPPPATFVDHVSPLDAGPGQKINAAFLNGVVSGLVDHEARISSTTLFSNVKDFGAKGDAVTFAAASITSGQTTLTRTGGNFSGVTAGMFVAVAGAGTSGAPLITTVQSVSGATITTANSAITTVAGVAVQAGTDDTAAIQAALDNGAFNGRPVFFPQGSYLTGTLTLPVEANVQGSGAGIIFSNWGRESRLLLKAGTNAPALIGTASGAQSVCLRDLKIDGQRAFQTVAAPAISQPDLGSALEMHWIIDNVQVYRNLGDGIYLGQNNRGTHVTRSYIYGCGGNGLHVKASDGQYNNNFIGANTGYGVFCEDGGWSNQIAFNNIWSNQAGINLLTVQLIWVVSNYIDSNVQQGMFVFAGTGINITGNTFISNNSGDGSHSSIHLQSMPTAANIVGNYFAPRHTGGDPLPVYDVFSDTGGLFTDSGNTRNSSAGAFTNTHTNGTSPLRGGLAHSGPTAGFYGTTPIAKPSSTPAAATDAATTQALVNDIRSKLIALGLIA